MFGLPNPYVIGGVALVIAALTGWALLERHDAIASAKGERAARLESQLHAADAERWQKASADRDAAIEQLKGAYKIQTDLVKQGRAKEQALSAALTDAANRNVALQETAEQLSKELDDDASKAPADVRELGPIVLRRAHSLFND